ncbi:type VII secretion-associated protein [Nocardia camponoti]|nr:type VII secretion-associated protein [Nocardia camponoti]
MLNSDHNGLIAGQPLNLDGRTASAVRHVVDEWLAFDGLSFSTAAAMRVVLTELLGGLRIELPCDRLVVVHPTSWSRRTRERFDDAARSLTNDVEFVPIAERVSNTDEATRRLTRSVCFEFDSLSTTATLVEYDGRGAHVGICEYDPVLAPVELASPAGRRALETMLTEHGELHRVRLLHVFGRVPPEILTVVREVAESVYEHPVEIRQRLALEISCPVVPVPVYTPTIAPSQAEWVGGLRARAAQDRPSRTRAFAVVAAVATVAIAAAAGLFLHIRGPEPSDSAALDTSARTPVPATFGHQPLTVTPPSSAPTTTVESVGRITFDIPAGWHRDVTSTRIELRPDSATPQRITLTQKAIGADVTIDAVRADLENQARGRPAGSLSPIRRGTVLSGQPGLSYDEHPADGSTVRWSVVLEKGLQVSTGCQYRGDWEAIRSACETVIGRLHVDS